MTAAPREPTAAFSLAARLRSGAGALAGWVGFPDPIFTEAVARSDFDAVVLDVQHGLHDAVSVVHGIAAVVAAGKPALVRVPVEDFALASRALDFGAAGVIAPMINSAADARRLVEFAKYPPRGRRSWGPGRAMVLGGNGSREAYLAQADGLTLALAMIETREGLAALDDILAVDGIDGVFVGPNDLCIALTDGAVVDPQARLLDEPLARIVAAARAAGKVAGIFGGSGARAGELARRGFGLVTVGYDTAYVAAGIEGMLAAAKG
ncbi:MAG: aldolase/citrate lyase family protein [Siculibacillus sp.]